MLDQIDQMYNLSRHGRFWTQKAKLAGAGVAKAKVIYVVSRDLDIGQTVERSFL